MMLLSHSQSANYFLSKKFSLSLHSFHGPLTLVRHDIWASLSHWPLDLRSPLPAMLFLFWCQEPQYLGPKNSPLLPSCLLSPLLSVSCTNPSCHHTSAGSKEKKIFPSEGGRCVPAYLHSQLGADLVLDLQKALGGSSRNFNTFIV